MNENIPAEERKNSILVVDDENSNILTLTRILSPIYTVYAAKNGKDAIDAASRYTPDIILLDIIMGDMDGYDVIAGLKNDPKTSEIPVIFVTGLTSASDEEKGFGYGVADYITKPFSPAIVRLRTGNQIKILEQKRLLEETLKRREVMLSALNRAASLILGTEDNDETFAEQLLCGMEIIGNSVDVDCVEIWQNEIRDGESYAVLTHYWFSETGKAIKSDSPVAEFKMNAVQGWEQILKDGSFIHGPVNSLSGEEQDFLNQFKIKTVLMIPAFVQNSFWGFCCIDDCRNSRRFTSDEVDILKTGTYMLVNAINRRATHKAMMEEMNNAEIARESSKAKSQFLANMSHEMRTPMNVVVGLTDLMLEEESLEEETKDSLKKISVAGNTLLALINDVLDISKIEAGKLDLIPVKYNVPSLLNDIVTLNIMRIEEKPIKFILDIDENLPATLFGDDLRIKQILNNILSNAFKYTQSGTVTFGMSCKREGEKVLVSFYVSDTGIGIRENDLNKLFTDYQQMDTEANRSIEGTGLGLSITKRLTDMMNGSISAESEYKKGSTFRVNVIQGHVDDSLIGRELAENLKSFRYQDDKNLVSKRLVRPDLSHIHVLVVDDMQTNLDVAAGLLGRYKMQIDCVLNGREAVNRLKIGKPAYDAVFMDHMMPGQDGIETANIIRSIDSDYAKNIPLIALTANAIQGTQELFFSNGFQAFLSKPIDIMRLDSIIKNIIVKKE